MEDFYRMTPLEVASGWVPGFEEVEQEPTLESSHPRAVLESLLLPALEKPPCFVEFSGGRDSSALLALATDVSRRHGLSLPVPMTRVFLGVPESREDEWQELVIRHLGIEVWHRTEYTDEFDLLGPTAAASLRRHGVLWPATIHTRPLVWAEAIGGTVVSGEGGDEIFGMRRLTPLAGLIARRVHPRRLAIAMALRNVTPGWIRRRFVTREIERRVDRHWLREAALREFKAALIDDDLAEPLWWSQATERHRYRRADRLGGHNFRVSASLAGVNYMTPLHHPRFLAALAREGGRIGFPGRTAAMRVVFGELLPEAVLQRTTKAEFTGAFFSDASRAFGKAWDGAGLDDDLVDADVLRAEWIKERPPAGTVLLLQAAWLSTETGNIGR